MNRFGNKKKIIPSSEFLSLNVDESKEELIPHSKDPIKDIAKIYWKFSETGTAITTKSERESHPESSNFEDNNEIKLNEYKTFASEPEPGEYEKVQIFKYYKSIATQTETVEMMAVKH